MSAYSVGQKVWYAGEAWRISRIWDTRTEGLRADLESLERVELGPGVMPGNIGAGAVANSAQLSDLDGRLNGSTPDTDFADQGFREMLAEDEEGRK